MARAPIDPELDAIRRRAPIGGLFADPLPPEVRHEAAIKSVEQSATPHETLVVEAVQAMLLGMDRWTADDVRDWLDHFGVPDTLEIRRRYASRITNGIRAKRKVGEQMTRHGARSGRKVAVWENVPE